MPTAQDSVYLPTIAQVLKVEPMTEAETLFTLELPGGGSLGNEPGQFVEVSLFGIGEAPISISSSPSRSNGTFEMCVRRVGDVTNAIHTLQPGDAVGVRGPFGEPFPVARMKGKDVLFACGGLGVAPLRSLINEVLDNRDDFGRVIILYGARDPSQILFRDDVAEWEARDDIEFHMTVDRGDDSWEGHVGVITTLFPDISINPQATIVAVCGPPIMYRFVMIELLGKGIPDAQIYLSLERRMKCGVGKCGHCQIDGLYCCQDGPVFRYADIKGLEAAL
jgi:sulfhydrogenase subunit gamma (sulfur reductase)